MRKIARVAVYTRMPRVYWWLVGVLMGVLATLLYQRMTTLQCGFTPDDLFRAVVQLERGKPVIGMPCYDHGGRVVMRFGAQP